MTRRLLDGLSHVDNYVDDVLVHTETWEEHIAALRALFVRVREDGLTLKLSKCCMAFESLDFVGQKIGQREVKTQDDKVERISNAPKPTTKKQVRSFLGLAGYYRKFVDNYCKIAAPLRDLTKAKRPNKVSWTEETNESFKQLKQALCNAPILKLPNVDKPFVLRTDASDTGLGAMLLQKHNGKLFPTAFASKKLNPAQKCHKPPQKRHKLRPET